MGAHLFSSFNSYYNSELLPPFVDEINKIQRISQDYMTNDSRAQDYMTNDSRALKLEC